MGNFFVKQLSTIYVIWPPLEGSYRTSTVKSLYMPLELLELITVTHFYLVFLSICCQISNMFKILRPVSSHTQRNTTIFPLSWKNYIGWPSSQAEVQFKILILNFKAYHEIGPKNLTDSLIKYTPSRTLPSTNKGLLVVPKYNLESYGKRAFSVIAPSLWNNLYQTK